MIISIDFDGTTLWYYNLPDIAFLVGPLIIGVVTAFLFIWLPFFAGDR